MEVHKNFNGIKAAIYDMPEVIFPNQYYEMRFACVDDESLDFDLGIVSAFGPNITSFDGVRNLPSEVKQLLNENGFSTDNLQDL